MDPTVHRLLRVKVEDAIEADNAASSETTARNDCPNATRELP